jgi:hypothetical protein
MPLRFPGSFRDAAWRLAIVFAIGFAGCQPAEQVSRYTAPKDPIDPDTISDTPAPGEPTVRILGAIVPTGKPGEENWYFFKFQPPHMGGSYPPRAIERHKADFDAFLASLKFPPNDKPTWTLPAGWREVDVKTQFPRLATFRMKKSETVVDLAVSEAKGGLLDNINRWRELQAGVEPITEAEIETKCKVLTVDGRRVVVVDVSGTGPKMNPPFGKK